MLQVYQHPHKFEFELGGSLSQLNIAYHTYGTMNADKSNVIWICHALTANADVADWWNGLVGLNQAIDPNSHYIVCANILGSCYGTSGPSSMDPQSQQMYGASFPEYTIRDMVAAHQLLKAHLQIDNIALLVGGSMGGYQALEWAKSYPDDILKLFLLATSPAESAWGIAIHTAQRMAIAADADWQKGVKGFGDAGLKAARAIGMLTYRNYDLFVQQQTDEDPEKTKNFKATSYIHYQAQKLADRFDALSYYKLSLALDSHNLARGSNKTLPEVLQSVSQPTLLIGISSDILCPPQEQRFMAQQLPNCTYHEIDSKYGHDGFLIEFEKTGKILTNWLNNK